MITRLIPRRVAAVTLKASIERDDEGFVVPAEMLAEAFGLTVDRIQECMRCGKITSRSEIGRGDDKGRSRLTFYYGDNAWRFIVDDNGLVLNRAGFPIRTRAACVR